LSREDQIVEVLLNWHRENRRNFPWREESDPYKVLIAEYFLQRTPAERVAKIYPEFIEDAKSEGIKNAERTFSYANEVEKIHHKLYEKALKLIEEGKDLDVKEMYICSVCGYTHEGTPPDKCPVCGAAKKAFEKIE